MERKTESEIWGLYRKKSNRPGLGAYPQMADERMDGGDGWISKFESKWHSPVTACTSGPRIHAEM